MADLLNIGLSGLAASKTQLSITGHNITNVNTPGYSRQDATQATRNPQFSGVGYIGSGTTLVDVRRTYSEFLTAQLRSSTALASDVSAYKSQIEQLDSLLAGSTTGITPSLQKFFSALQTAAEDPSNMPARQLVLAESEGLARRFNTVYDRLNEQNTFTNRQMGTITDQVNRLAGSIGKLNDAIASAAANGKQPNDLLDAREEAIRELSTYVGVSVVPQDDSGLNISIGSGQPLVVGNKVARLEVVAGKGDPTRHEVQFVSGGSRQTITTQITGGELGGLIRYREEVLDSTMNSLGRLALAVSDQVNSQLGQGLDLKGNVGAALFVDYNSEELMALRATPFSDNPSLNTKTPSDASLKITDTRQLTGSDYRLEYRNGEYTARRLSDGAPITIARLLDGDSKEVVDNNGNPVWRLVDAAKQDQGFELSTSGTAQEGDRFLLQPTRRGGADIEVKLDQADQLAFAAPVRAQAGAQNAGTGKITQPDLLSFEPKVADDEKAMAALSSYLSSGITFTYGTDGNFSFPEGITANPDIADGKYQPGTANALTVLFKGDGFTFELGFQLSGTPKPGDTFALSFNQNGVSDNRNALKLVDLQSKQTVGVSLGADGKVTSGASFTDGYGELVERVGTLTAQARMDGEATTSILKQTTDNRDSLSAVNLDEEAANLIKFEQYYNASAQIIQVARSLFDTLITSLR